MAYFESFPERNYDPIGTNQYKTIKDILLRIKLKDTVSARNAVFEKYDIKDGETPESIANKYYGNPNLHWIILFTNEVLDPFYEWPLSLRDFDKYVIDKYANPNATHHHEISQSSGSSLKKITVPSNTPGATAITNYEYETSLQDKRKQIKLLKREYVLQIVSEFNRKISRR